MLLASLIPPIKGIGIAGKAGIKGAKAAEAATDVSKSVSQTKHVLRYDKVMPALQAAYLHVVKAPITNTICSFKKQWNDLLASIPFVRGSRTWRESAQRPAYGWSEAEKEAVEVKSKVHEKRNSNQISI